MSEDSWQSGFDAGIDSGYDNGYETGRQGGIEDGWDMALQRVLDRSETYFKVDPASRRLVANLVAKVKEEGL